MGLNYVHEAANSLYIKHVYNGAMANTYLGDELFGADRTIRVEEKIANADKRVHELTATTKEVVEQAARWGNTSNRRGGNSFGGGR